MTSSYCNAKCSSSSSFSLPASSSAVKSTATKSNSFQPLFSSHLTFLLSTLVLILAVQLSHSFLDFSTSSDPDSSPSSFSSSSSSSSSLCVGVSASNLPELTVHVIAHSHCDPGWLNTFEGYYAAEVRSILDSVVRELAKDKNRKFTWSETSYFYRWYESQSHDTKQLFKRLVSSGQWEFVNGGWSQHDEACPDPTSMINQMTEGHSYLLQQFGIAPRVGWQIDPFGHSSVTPTLLAHMGMEALVINRIHVQLKESFKQTQQMEFFWRGSALGDSTTDSDLFTHVLHTHYSAVPGFDWEESSIPIDNANVQVRATEYCNVMRARAAAYRSPHLLVPFGDDFKFKQAERQYTNMDRIIQYINSHTDLFHIHIQYSTPRDYFKAIATQQNGAEFPTFRGDFFPYADNDESYWVGYYTTRPMLKERSRRLSAVLRSAELLHTLVRASPRSNYDSTHTQLAPSYWENKYKDLEKARQEAALFLHHDAITGTSRMLVVQDYIHRMDSASEKLLALMCRMMEHLITIEPNPTPAFTHSPYTLTASAIISPPASPPPPISYPILLYNSLAWIRSELISVRVGSRNVKVFDSNGKLVPSQIDSYWSDLKEYNPSQSVFTLSFIATIPPLGAATYFVVLRNGPIAESDSSSSSSDGTAHQAITRVYFSSRNRLDRGAQSKYLAYESIHPDSTSIQLDNELMTVHISPITGLIQRVVDKTTQTGFNLRQSFSRYSSVRSGAYLFRPQGTAVHIDGNLGDEAIIRLSDGPIVATLSVKHYSFDIQMQLVKIGASGVTGEAALQLGGHVSIWQSVHTDANTELMGVFSSDLKNAAVFHTHNGLSWMKRTRRVEPVAANVYPAVTGGRLAATPPPPPPPSATTPSSPSTPPPPPSRFTILSAHTMGCSSQSEGELQFHMHRSLSQDDGRGLNEAVIDTTRVELTFWLALDAMRPDADFQRRSLRLNHPVIPFYRVQNSRGENAGETPESWPRTHLPSFQPLTAPLPDHLHLFSLLSRDALTDDIAIRLQHIDDESVDDSLVDLSQLFDSQWLQVDEMRRVSLSLNTVWKWNGGRMREWTFKHAATNKQLSEAELQQRRAAAMVAAANQNSKEAGVFISQAALNGMANAAAAAAPGGGHAQQVRRLLMEVEGEASTTSLSTRITVSPLQLHSYVMRLIGVESELARKQIAEVRATQQQQQSSPISIPTPPSPIPTPPIADLNAIPNPSPEAVPLSPSSASLYTSFSSKLLPDQPSMPQGGGHHPTSHVGDHSFNHMDPDDLIHQHQSVPGRSREAWTVIPTRMEYLIVLMSSFSALLFFMNMLKVVDCGSIYSGGKEKWRRWKEWIDQVLSDENNNNVSGIELRKFGSRSTPSGSTLLPSPLTSSGRGSSATSGNGIGSGSVGVDVDPFDPKLYADDDEYDNESESGDSADD